MSLRSLLNRLFGHKTHRKPLNADTNMEKALRVLVAREHITVRDILRFTNDGTKLVFLLRKSGYLHPLGDPKGEQWAKNASGTGRHKVYKWTGKIPANWIKSDTYTGRERRKSPRGNK